MFKKTTKITPKLIEYQLIMANERSKNVFEVKIDNKHVFETYDVWMNEKLVFSNGTPIMTYGYLLGIEHANK